MNDLVILGIDTALFTGAIFCMIAGFTVIINGLIKAIAFEATLHILIASLCCGILLARYAV